MSFKILETSNASRVNASRQTEAPRVKTPDPPKPDPKGLPRPDAAPSVNRTNAMAMAKVLLRLTGSKQQHQQLVGLSASVPPLSPPCFFFAATEGAQPCGPFETPAHRWIKEEASQNVCGIGRSDPLEERHIDHRSIDTLEVQFDFLTNFKGFSIFLDSGLIISLRLLGRRPFLLE